MTLEAYKQSIRKYRGHLASVDTELELMHGIASDKFLEFTLSNKLIGIRKMSYIVTIMNEQQQDEFVKWIHEAKRTKTDIDMKLLEY